LLGLTAGMIWYELVKDNAAIAEKSGGVHE